MEELEVIAIDHGWSLMKTPSSVFVSGIKEITTEPALKDNLLLYKGKYYRVGGKRMEVRPTKVIDETYYLLTLAAIAKELKLRKKQRYILQWDFRFQDLEQRRKISYLICQGKENFLLHLKEITTQ